MSGASVLPFRGHQDRSRGTPRASTRRLIAGLLLGAHVVLAGAALPAQEITRSHPDYFFYQVPFPPSPRDGAAALATFDQRASAMIRAVACGSELAFALNMGKAGEDVTATIIGKMEWLAGRHDASAFPEPATLCQFTRDFIPFELCRFSLSAGCESDAVVQSFAKSAFYQDLRRGRITALNDNLKLRFSPFCAAGRQGLHRDGVVVASGPPFPGDLSDVVRIDFAVERDCMIGQINAALMSMQRVGQMGTDGAPCNGSGILSGSGTVGDWDMTVRNLTRIVYLDDRYGQSLLTPVVRDHVHVNLLTADGGPADETYSLLGCGNTHESTGSSQDRADERGWIDDVGSWLEDAAKTLFKWLAIFFVGVAVAALVVGVIGTTAVGFWLGAAAGAAATAVTIIAVQADVPETENHLLMINTSAYLKNQYIINDLGWDSDAASSFKDDQEALKGWMLGRMQGYLQRDFVEHNSRPYHRLSIVAILNIADFANDDDLRTAAQAVLDYTTAKFNVGSQQGRRSVPFRRLRGVLAANILPPDTTTASGLFDLASGGDVQTAMGLLFAGQVQQLRGRRISFGAASAAIYFTTSPYRPEAFVTDLAIRKDEPVFQRIHYETSETYSSGRSFLISAGGTTTAQAYSGSGVEWIDQMLAEKVKGDLGLALPTTLFLAGTQASDSTDVDRTTMRALIRIEGKRPSDATYPSFDHNLCVWVGFACGTNLVIPTEFSNDPVPGQPRCMEHVVSDAEASWDFIDSRLCPAYVESPRFWIAIYRHECPAGGIDCNDNFGFFEVVDVWGANDDFSGFKARVLQANPPGFVTSLLSGFQLHRMHGTYRSQRGEDIEFSADAHQGSENLSGILSVGGVTQAGRASWPFAGGDASLAGGIASPIRGSGGGHLVITNPRSRSRLVLDLRDAEHPVRTLLP